jgi:hypothetical protein
MRMLLKRMKTRGAGDDAGTIGTIMGRGELDVRYDAVAFLEGLFKRAPDLTPDDLSAAWREVYEERAAIREYDGGLPRELAEHHALLDVLDLMKTKSRQYPDSTNRSRE